MTLAARLEAMWWRRQTPPLPLRWASRLYDIVNRRNLARREAAAMQPSVPLISVGNITAGGSGKTPFVIWLCSELVRRGYKPVVLCRGDGGTLQQPKRILPDDAPETAGDEALLLALRCEAPVIAGRDRMAGCRMAAELGDIIILDDGFQYRQLSRSCDIVLVPVEGIGNGHLLPAGPLREGVDALARADLVVRTGEGETAALGEQREWHWKAEPQPIRSLCAGEPQTSENWLLLAGIARAERFFAMASQGVQVGERMRFADHYRYTAEDVADILKYGLPVLTTEKDAVKLLPLWPKHKPLSVLPLAGRGEEGLPEAIIGTMLRRQTTSRGR
jgi:tetraacyldisaccharide 4'-kinase